MYERIRVVGIIAVLLGCWIMAGQALAQPSSDDQSSADETSVVKTIRIATFNASLYGKKAGEIRERLSDRDDLRARRIASVIQTVRPDVLLVNELDYEPGSAPAKLLAQNYFAVAQTNSTDDGQLKPIDYPYLFSAPSNTGIDSSMDLNKDGKLKTGNDSWGYGVYPGQYAMTVYSRFPIQAAEIRSFQNFLWKDMPDALRPVDPKTGSPYYDDTLWSQLRLSSKNHIDVPIQIGDHVLHVLASHPTPPVFDGPEDRNGARNHDEVQFWNHYLTDNAASKNWLIDDAGNSGGLDQDARFVVMGDLNSDPVEGSGRRDAIKKLLGHERVNDTQPKASKADAAERASWYRGPSDVRSKTADFGRNGLMRVDFVIPSRNLSVVDSGVFWPPKSDPKSRWASASDHRMVWIEVKR